MLDRSPRRSAGLATGLGCLEGGGGGGEPYSRVQSLASRERGGVGAVEDVAAARRIYNIHLKRRLLFDATAIGGVQRAGFATRHDDCRAVRVPKPDDRLAPVGRARNPTS